ncbi:hypothetical protein Tco_0378762 [Tanacetum coccineum]
MLIRIWLVLPSLRSRKGMMILSEAKRWYVPRWNITNDSLLDDGFSCRTMVDRVALPALFSALRSMDCDQLYTEFNVGVARQICLGSEVRSRAEHELELKEKLNAKYAARGKLLEKKDSEILRLKSQLVEKKVETAEETDIQQKNIQKESQKRPNQARNGKDKVISKPKETSVLRFHQELGEMECSVTSEEGCDCVEVLHALVQRLFVVSAWTWKNSQTGVVLARPFLGAGLAALVYETEQLFKGMGLRSGIMSMFVGVMELGCLLLFGI